MWKGLISVVLKERKWVIMLLHNSIKLYISI